MKKRSNILWGVLFIVVGFVFILDVLNIATINLFFDGWWTLFIIIPSLVDFINEEDKTGSAVGLLIGGLLLLGCQGVFDLGFILKLIFPIALVFVGLSFVYKSLNNRSLSEEIEAKIKENKKDDEHVSVFSSQKLDFSDEKFNGCSLTTIFGGIDCDLRNATLKNNTVINVTSIFGGVDIYVPKDVEVKVTSTCVFGGVSNKTKKEAKTSKKTIYIKADCIFGGVEIK